MQITAFARTDVGRVRPENEDDFFVGEQVFAVADGMGGHAAGEVAAKMALEPLTAIDNEAFDGAEDAEEALVEALRQANRQVVEKAENEPELDGMGTTLTAGLLLEGRLHLAHVGDSRAYLLRGDEAITQLTTDHTLVEKLVREGRLSRDEAATHPQRNVVTRAIGNDPQVLIDSLPALRLEPGDQILLCSDGLTGVLSDSDIAAILTHTADGDEAVSTLVDRANQAGGPDNITVVLLRVRGEATDEPAPGSEGTIHKIRTRSDEESKEWAHRLGELGAPQGAYVSRRDKGDKGSGKSKRALAALLAVVLLIGVVAGGGWLLLSRAYFVGSHEGQVAIFRGVPEQVWNVSLYWVIEDEVTDLPLSDFPEWRQDTIGEGITARTITEAQRIVTNLERSIDRSAPAGDAGQESRRSSDDEDVGGV